MARRRKRTRGRRPRRTSIPIRFLAGLGLLLGASALLVAPLRWIDPPLTAFMLGGSLRGEFESLRQHWVPLEEISPYLQLCVLTAEDQKFPSHGGFDVQSIVSALEATGPSRGASTISQQVAKNVYLWPGRSWLRKGIEAYLTLWIEALWPKARILEVYLNVAEFGPGIYGAEAASQWAFHRPARYLELTEACLLAAVLPSPKRMSASEPSDYVRERSAIIRAAALELGLAFLGSVER